MARRESVPWWKCPNDPPCPHGALIHDVDDYDDETPTCCAPDCTCGHDLNETNAPGGTT